MYPIQGMYYLLSHSSLMKPFLSILPVSLGISAVVLVFCFTVLYLPQAFFMSVLSLNPFGAITAIPLTLSEASFIINLILRTFVLEDKTTEVFDAVLLQKGHDKLVSAGREIKKTSGSARVGKLVSRPLARFSPQAVAYYLLTLPLQLVSSYNSPQDLLLTEWRSPLLVLSSSSL